MNINDVAQIVMVQIVGTVFAAVGVYTAIRADLAQLNARLKIVEDNANNAHSRIDSVITRVMR